MDNFQLKTLKIGSGAFHSLKFQLKCLDFQCNQYKKLTPVLSRFCNGLYGLPKIHIANTPLRPIVSCVITYAYDLSAILPNICLWSPLKDSSNHSGIATRRNNGTMGGLKCTNHSWPSLYELCLVISRPHRLKNTSSKQSKQRDLHLKWYIQLGLTNHLAASSLASIS